MTEARQAWYQANRDRILREKRLGDNSAGIQRAVSYLAAFEDSVERAIA